MKWPFVRRGTLRPSPVQLFFSLKISGFLSNSETRIGGPCSNSMDRWPTNDLRSHPPLPSPNGSTFCFTAVIRDSPSVERITSHCSDPGGLRQINSGRSLTFGRVGLSPLPLSTSSLVRVGPFRLPGIRPGARGSGSWLSSRPFAGAEPSPSPLGSVSLPSPLRSRADWPSSGDSSGAGTPLPAGRSGVGGAVSVNGASGLGEGSAGSPTCVTPTSSVP